MGEFDCYCFLCSGPLVPCEVGSTSPGWLNRRRRRVKQKLDAIEAGHSFDSLDSGSEHESDNYSGDEDIYIDDERRSYDPDIATAERVDWINQVRVLGLNKLAVGDAKAFISGPASYDDAGLINVEKGEDPNQPPVGEKPFFDCYVSSNDNEVVFPFHPHCMTVLEKAFQWSSSRSQGPEERSRLDLNVLYKTAVRIGGLGNLKLDYGGIHGVDQCWESIPGEEFSVIDPLEFPLNTLDFYFKSSPEQNALPLRNRAIIDPFQNLPIEIVHIICRYMPGDALRAFLTASATAYYATRDPAFWKPLCVSRLPWAWELWKDNDIARQDATTGSKIDYKRLYLCLELNTAKRFGMTMEMSGWMGITNRRRIWYACVQLLEEYRQDCSES